MAKKEDKNKKKKVVLKKTSKKYLKKSRSSPKKIIKKEAGAPVFIKFDNNPIILPNTENVWETRATFNPAAIYADGKVHIFYRAIGDNDVSVFGYASSSDGFSIDKRSDEPAYQRTWQRSSFDLPIVYGSGGSWNGGCEDPRLTVIGDTVYMLYTAFDGWGSLRIALTSIKLEDFLNEKWNWKGPVLISPPGEIHKNWTIFPEKINGKYAILHSISPKILIDYVDSMDEFNGKRFIKSQYGVDSTRKNFWDSSIRGAGPPPIKTEQGWLLLYHAMDNKDPNKYKIGAMLLDLKDPAKILHRSEKPLLEPEECYENEGFKAGVVYSCGAVVFGGKLMVYYGGADKVTCVATADFNDLLKKLVFGGKPELKSAKKIAKKSKR